MSTAGRKRTRSRAERRDELRDRLLDAVEGLLRDGEAYDDLSVSRIASLAGISRATFYVYFQDKSDLLRAWFQGIEDELEAPIRGWLTSPGEMSRADLVAKLGDVIEAYRPHAHLMAATFDAAAYDAEVRAVTDAMMARHFARMTEHIRRGQELGFIDPDLPPEQTAELLGWMSERGFHMFLRDATDDDVRRLSRSFADVFCNALYEPMRASSGGTTAAPAPGR